MDTAIDTSSPKTLVLHGVTLSPSIAALVCGDEFVGDAEWKEPLEHALALAKCIRTDINVRAGGTSVVVWWPPVDKDWPPVAIAVPLGHDFMKSSKRWCARFAKAAAKKTSRVVSTVKK